MATRTDTKAAAALRELMGPRTDSVTALSAALEDYEDCKAGEQAAAAATAAAAERARTRQAEAVAAGWTLKELAGVGLAAPALPRRRSSTDGGSSGVTTDDEHQHTDD